MERYLLYINDKSRRDQYREIFDDDFVPIVSPETHVGKFKGETSNFFKLNLDLVTDDQREKLIKQISERFKIDKLTVSRLFDFHGVPILAIDCVVYVATKKQGLREVIK